MPHHHPVPSTLAVAGLTIETVGWWVGTTVVLESPLVTKHRNNREDPALALL